MAPATKLWDSVSAIPVGQAQTAMSIVQGFRPVAGKRGVNASNLRKTELLLSWQGEGWGPKSCGRNIWETLGTEMAPFLCGFRRHCVCDDGFGGDDCGQSHCPKCLNGGTCVEAETRREQKDWQPNFHGATFWQSCVTLHMDSIDVTFHELL